MSERAISVGEAARDFLNVLALVESRREPATLVRDGHPVARLVPLPQSAATCGELAERWKNIFKLPSEEAGAFADDLEQARTTLSPPKPAWD